MYYKDNPEIFDKKSNILKALSHPIRLCIVKNLIENGKTNVSEMQQCLEAPQSTISQHLAKLKSENIIKGNRKGLEIYYSVTNDNIKNLIKILFEKQ